MASRHLFQGVSNPEVLFRISLTAALPIRRGPAFGTPSLHCFHCAET